MLHTLNSFFMTDCGFCSFLLNISQELCSVKDSILCAFEISSFSQVQLFATLWSVAHQAPLSKGILQARILEWVAMPSSRGSSQPRDQTCVCCVSCVAGRFCTTELQGNPQNCTCSFRVSVNSSIYLHLYHLCLLLRSYFSHYLKISLASYSSLVDCMFFTVKVSLIFLRVFLGLSLSWNKKCANTMNE